MTEAGFSQSFRPGSPARWWTRFGVAAILAALLALVLLRSSGQAPRVAWALALGALAALLPLLPFLARQALDRRAVLTLSEEGLASHQLDRLVRWHELEDVRLEQRLGHGLLGLQLQARAEPAQRRRLGARRDPLVARIRLRLLPPADQEAAFRLIGERLRALPGRHELGDVPGVRAHRHHHDFENRLTRLTPVPWALYGVVMLNIGVWVATVLDGIHPSSPTPQSLFRWGANSAWAVVNDGQAWRLLTAPFLHGGAVHLAFNMLGLWAAGRLLCRWYGNRQFLLVYLGSALVGSGLSLHFASQANVSVGASGAVFGVLGAVLVGARVHRERIPSLTSRHVLTSQGLFAAYALLQGFIGKGIDNAAHVGGLLAGAALAALLVGPLQQEASARQQASGRGKAIALIGVAVLALVLSTPAPRIDHRRLFAVQATYQRLLPQMQAAEAALQHDMEAARQGEMSQAELLAALKTVHLPAYRRIGQAFSSLTLPPTDPASAGLDDLKTRLRLLAEVLRLQAAIAEAAPFERMELKRRLAERSAELHAVSTRLKEQLTKEHSLQEPAP